MANRVDVSNLALGKLGEDSRLTDPADPSKAAREIAACWDAVRRRVLRANVWNFATRRFLLPQLAGIAPDNIWPYTAAYQLPPESVRFVDILSPRLDTSDWQNEGGRILVRGGGAIRVRCVVDVVAIEAWDDLAVEALASAIAFQIADALTGDEARKNAARADGKAAIASAAGTDAIENPPIEAEEDDWILARFR